MTRRGRAVVACFIALLIALALAGEAYAHASLVKASPADGAVVPVAPAVLSLTFNEPVSPLVIRLIGPDGASIEPGAVVAENNDGHGHRAGAPATRHARAELARDLVRWTSGRRLADVLDRRAERAARGGSRSWRRTRRARCRCGRPRSCSMPRCSSASAALSSRAWIADPVSRRRSQPWLLMLLAAGLVAAPASVALQGVDALDLPLSGLAQKVSWQTGLETSYGLTAIAAAFALFAGLFACVGGVARASPEAWRSLGLLGVGLALSLSGHASTAAAASSSADRRCSCTRYAWRSGSGHCCRSLWACVMPACVPRRPAAANSGASPARSSR